MSALHWFEIAVNDIQGAKTFYETVMATQLRYVDMREAMGSELAMFPARDGVGGTLVANAQQGYKPHAEGTLVYLVVDGDLNEVLGRVADAGGEVVLPKTSLGERDGGFVGWVIDSEGNKVGFYSKE